MRLLNTLTITAATASAFSFSDASEFGNSALAAVKRSVATSSALEFSNSALVAVKRSVATSNALEFSNSALAAIKRSVSTLRARKDGGGSCPAVWSTVSKELVTKFVANGQCNDDARAAIRAAFHDCGAWNTAQGQKGGCDGSLVNTRFPTPKGGNAEELNRDENGGLGDISKYLFDTQQKYVQIDKSVTVADMIQFAGAVAIVSCPGGPQIKTYVGRKDSTDSAPDGLLPSVVADASSLFKLFSDKGFSAVDLAALLGAHSTSKAFHQASHNIPVGAAQDSSPGTWDVKYYSETLQIPVNTDPNASPDKVAVFPSDKNLATDDKTPVKKEFAGFVNNQGKWRGKFADA